MEKEKPVLENDGLHLPKVRWWAKEKHTILERYLDIFSTSMKDKWPKRIYVDLFSGAGMATIVDENKKPKEIIETSSLIAAKLKYPFTHLLLCEKNKKNADALAGRLDSLNPKPRYTLFNNDANECINKIVAQIPTSSSLNLAFIDPFGLHLSFDTVIQLSARKIDLIILLADNMDAMRNCDLYDKDPDSNMDSFFCTGCDWRSHLINAGPRFPTVFRELYENCLRTLGYSYFGTKRVQNSRQTDIYTLLFASKNKLGLKFWQEAKSVDAKGQRGLFHD